MRALAALTIGIIALTSCDCRTTKPKAALVREAPQTADKDGIAFCKQAHIQLGTVALEVQGKDGQWHLVREFHFSTRPMAMRDGQTAFIDFSGELPGAAGRAVKIMLGEGAVTTFAPDEPV